MKYLDEYRDGERAQQMTRGDAPRSPPGPGKSWKSAAARRTPSSSSASIELLPKSITLIHGPGCPVCVTPLEMIDKAMEIAAPP